MKTPYIKPEMLIIKLVLQQIICNSPVTSARGPFEWEDNLDDDDQ